MQRQENNFDLIRLVAACEVAIIHANHFLGSGDDLFFLEIMPGVPVFFFLSGLLIFPSFAASRSLLHYVLKRCARIYPALYLCFGLCVAGLLAVGFLTTKELASLDFATWVFAQLTVFQFYTPDLLRDFGSGVLNGSLWTVSVELQLYAITPVVAYLVSRWPAAWAPLLGLSVLINLAFQNVLAPESFVFKLINVSFAPWLYMFLAGAWLSTRHDLVQRIRALPLAVPLLAFLGAVFLTRLTGQYAGGNYINPLMFATLAVLVVHLAYKAPTLASRLLGGNDVSYGLYIYHMPVINFMLWYSISGSWLPVATALAVSMVFAIASWNLVERPAIQTARRAASQRLLSS